MPAVSPEEALHDGNFRLASLMILVEAYPYAMVEEAIVERVNADLPNDYDGEDPLAETIDALMELVVSGLVQWDEPEAEAGPLHYRLRMQEGGDG